jgi:hypothetical protein
MSKRGRPVKEDAKIRIDVRVSPQSKKRFAEAIKQEGESLKRNGRPNLSEKARLLIEGYIEEINP